MTRALFDEGFLKKLEFLHVVARKVFAGQMRAERRSKKTGAGVEFADHRAYAPGDDLRTLDWGVYGRLGKLLVRLFEEEEDLHIYILVDSSASMASGLPVKLDYAKQVVAALAYVGLSNLDRVSVLAFSDGLKQRLPAMRGKGRIFKIFDFLTALEPDGATDLARSVESFVHQTKRRGVVVLVTDGYDAAGIEAPLNLLRYHRFDPFVLQLVDEEEAHPRLVGDLEIVDVETGEVRVVTVSPRVAADVARAHAALCASIEQFCAERAIPYVRADTTTPFDELLLRVLRKGGLVA